MSSITLDALERALNERLGPNTDDVDPAFLTENSVAWDRFESDVIIPGMHLFKWHFQNMVLTEDDQQRVTYTAYISVEPKSGKGSSYIVGLKHFVVLQAAEGLAEPGSDDVITNGVGPRNGRQNIQVLLKRDENDIRDLLGVVRAWRQIGGNVVLGYYHPHLARVPIVSHVRPVGNRLHMFIIEHRNLERPGKPREFATTPSEVFGTACCNYLKLVYSTPTGPRVRFFRVQGGFQRKDFAYEIPLFDLSELPA